MLTYFLILILIAHGPVHKISELVAYALKPHLNVMPTLPVGQDICCVYKDFYFSTFVWKKQNLW